MLTLLAGLHGGKTSAQEATAADQDKAAAQFRSGQEAFRSLDFAAAEAAFKVAILMNPRLGAAHCALGQTYMSMRRYAAAVQALTACKRISAEEAQRSAAETSAAEQAIQNEIQDLRDLIRRLEALHDATRQTDITRLEGRVDRLEQQRRRALMRFEVPAAISFALGTAHLKNGSLEDAEREFRAALRVRPDYGEAHNNLAVVYMALGLWEKAEEQIKAAEKAGFRVSQRMMEDLHARQLSAPVMPPSAPGTDTSAVPVEPPKVTIEHPTLGCVLHSQFPRIEARIRPVESVQRAWVRFRSDEKAGWYSVPLRREGDVYVGLLPKPKWAKSFAYYLEAVNQSTESTRTPESSVAVVKHRHGCGEMQLSPSLADASGLIVEKPPGASPKATGVPPGFSGRGTVWGIGAFDWSPRTTFWVTGGMLTAGGVAVAALKGQESGHEAAPAPVFLFRISIRSSAPPPGSTISLSGGSLAMRLTVELHSTHQFGEGQRPAFIRVDFFGPGSATPCVSMMSPKGPGSGAGVDDFIVNGPLVASQACTQRFTTTQVTASLLVSSLSLAPDTAPVPLDVAYTFVP